LKQKRHTFDIQLNAIYDTDNPTKKECEFVLHGFDVSANYAFISKEVAEKSLPTLNSMPIVAKYYEKSDYTEDDDALGSHEVEFTRDRDDGDPIIVMGTVPIGVFTENAYIKTIEVNGEDKEVVCGKGILWASRFPNVIGLLQEWVDEGITVVSSMEILFDSYKVEEGITEILSYVYEGHCLINSESRGDHNKVYPAYDESKLTKLVAQAINQENKQQNNKKERENMPEKFKKVFELSHSDIRTQIYREFDANLHEDEYSWIVDSYDSYFIINIFGNGSDKYYKYNYTKNENDVTIDYDSKKEVVEERKWVELEEVRNLQADLKQVKENLETNKNQLNEANKSVETLKSEKEKAQEDFNKASETITQLNTKVEKLKPYKEQADTEAYEQSLNEKKELYKGKFDAVGGTETFDSDEVQDLIKKSLNENNEGKDAEYQLNQKVFELINVEKEENQEETTFRESYSKREDLVPDNQDFDSRYSE
jgi:hypothetical protein